MAESSNDSEATPPSAPRSAASARAPTGRLALTFALVAAACSWNALGAPFAVLTALGAFVLAVRALRRGAPLRTAGFAMALAIVGAAVGAVVLGTAAGFGPGPERDLGIQPRSAAELQRVLDEAAAQSRATRDRAARELEELPAQRTPGDAAPKDHARGAAPTR
jgi:predicted anti-sigma-YlaC factor YlaD